MNAVYTLKNALQLHTVNLNYIYTYIATLYKIIVSSNFNKIK